MGLPCVSCGCGPGSDPSCLIVSPCEGSWTQQAVTRVHAVSPRTWWLCYWAPTPASQCCISPGPLLPGADAGPAGPGMLTCHLSCGHSDS